MSAYEIDIANRQSQVVIDRDELRRVAGRVLADEVVAAASISVAIVDNTEIHRVNRDFLQHDFPTDVISFLLDATLPDEFTGDPADDLPRADEELVMKRGRGLAIDGEIVISAEMAEQLAEAHGWSSRAELVLYLIHGLLHLCGYDDLADGERRIMRRRERELLLLCGFSPAPGWSLQGSGASE